MRFLWLFDPLIPSERPLPLEPLLSPFEVARFLGVLETLPWIAVLPARTPVATPRVTILSTTILRVTGRGGGRVRRR
jgi:hypothetical protein